MSEISFYGTGFIAEPLKPRLDIIYQTSFIERVGLHDTS